jgi:CBS domain-containing protein
MHVRSVILGKEYVCENTGDTAMTVESILRQKGTDIVTITPEASIKTAADWLRTKNIGALVVMSGDAILGLISERDIVHAFFGMVRLWCLCP